MRELFYRSPLAKGVKAWLVYENDYFDDHDQYNKYPDFVKYDGDRGNLKLVFCVAELATGYILYEKMTVREIEEHKLKYVKGWRYKDSGWQKNYEAQARKTVLIKVLKDCPMEEVQQAITQEEATYHQAEPDADFMGEGDVKDPNEIVSIPDTAETLHVKLADSYRELMRLSNTYTKDYIISLNQSELGVSNLRHCQDVGKLRALYNMLENEIYNFKEESYD